MQIAAVDVHYSGTTPESALGAALVFERWDAKTGIIERVHRSKRVAPYVPGRFFERELPCVLPLLEALQSRAALSAVLVDGYVDLGVGPGLGRYLFEALGSALPVVGIAKSEYAGAGARQVFRGASERPLWVSATERLDEFADAISRMHGKHRIPTLLQRVDHLARGLTPPSSGAVTRLD
ncbi:MAG: endonuclease V [Myxococcota bacterium]